MSLDAEALAKLRRRQHIRGLVLRSKERALRSTTAEASKQRAALSADRAAHASKSLALRTAAEGVAVCADRRHVADRLHAARLQSAFTFSSACYTMSAHLERRIDVLDSGIKRSTAELSELGQRLRELRQQRRECKDEIRKLARIEAEAVEAFILGDLEERHAAHSTLLEPA